MKNLTGEKRRSRSRGPILAAVLLACVARPGPCLWAQTPDRVWMAEVMPSVAALNYDYLEDSEWHLAGTARLRLLLFNWVHIEVAFTSAKTRRSDYDCPPLISCDRSDPAPIDIWSGGIGLHRQRGLWMPSCGITKGRLWQHAGDVSGEVDTWGWYAGIERRLRGPFSIGLEVRMNRGARVSSWDNHRWTKQIGVGVGVIF
jgi:hypothetical protein